MKTDLVFFDGLHSSKHGTLRGLIAFILLILISSLWFFLTYNCIYKSSVQNLNFTVYSARTILSCIVIYLLICSALGVQLPSSWYNAFVYGSLVGVVVFGVSNLTIFALVGDYSILTATMDTVFATVMCGLISICVYYVSNTAG